MSKELFFVRNSQTQGLASRSKRTKHLLWKYCGKWMFKHSFECCGFFRVFLLRLFGAKIGNNCYIASSVNVTTPWDVVIGNNSSFDSDVYINGKITVGDYVSCASHVHFISGGHDVRSRGFEYYTKHITIGDGCFIGADVNIIGEVSVGTFSVIGAGSVVLKSISENTIAYGNPCEEHGCRIDKEIYETYRYVDEI